MRHDPRGAVAVCVQGMTTEFLTATGWHAQIGYGLLNRGATSRFPAVVLECSLGGMQNSVLALE